MFMWQEPTAKGSVIAYLYTTLMKSRISRWTVYFPIGIFLQRKDRNRRNTDQQGKFAEHTTRVAAVIEEMTAEGLAHPTPFEIETAVAFFFFCRRKM